MAHSPVPCRRSLFNASTDDIAMPDVDNSGEMVRYNKYIIYCTFIMFLNFPIFYLIV